MQGIFEMLIGLPASGKSSYCKELEAQGAIIVSSDSIREEVLGDVNDQDHNTVVFEIFNTRIKDALKEGKYVVADATNLNAKRRTAFLQTLPKDCEKRATVIATPFDVCAERNEKRERTVPFHVLKRMYKSFQMPYFHEGFDKIQVIDDFMDNAQIISLERQNELVEHDNPHHTLTCGKHCQEAKRLAEKVVQTACGIELSQFECVMLLQAARFHDIGKFKTKTFTNTKGERTEIAHFYNHESVSAYDYLCYATDQSVLKIPVAWLISNHMVPFNEGALKKLKKKMDDERLLRLLEILHGIDMKAK